MKTPALIVIMIATAFMVSAASPQDAVGSKDQQGESGKKIKELRRERIATLKEMADEMTQLFQMGRLDIDEACEANLLLLTAEADAAENESDRIQLYQNFVGVMKEYEEIAKARRTAARGTHASVLKVKARRLDAEIALEQLKAKATK